MAKKQDFVVGSTNPNTNTWTTAELNNGWNKYQVLKSGDLDGVFNAVSDYSNDSSQEIWNAISILKGSNPTGSSTSELGNIISTVLGAKATKATDFITPLTSSNKGATAADLDTLREEIETSSLTFKGYVSTSAPSSSTYGLVEGNIWINASAMPTTFPVAIAGVWNGTSWATTTDTYTVKDFDFFRNINNNEGYYWFGGQWTVMSTDMSTTYFTLNQTSGKWEIKSSVNLPGSPTTTTPAAGNSSTRIATTAFVANNFAKLASPDFTGTPTAPTATAGTANTQIATTAFVATSVAGFAPLASPAFTGTPTAPTPAAADDSTKIATTAWVRANMPSVSEVVPVAAILPYGGTTAPSGYLMCNGQAVSRTTYSALFSVIGTAYGTGDGSTTFNLPNYTDRVAQGLGRGYLSAGLPNITGSTSRSVNLKSTSGSFYQGAAFGSDLWATNGWGNSYVIEFDASRSSSIYGNSTTVQPAAIKTYWIIKY